MIDAPANGSVIHYPYLWKWQRDKDETEGRKNRPVCVVLSLRNGDLTSLILLVISSTPPSAGQTALEIPELECRRAGLREWKDAWITVSEYNHDIAEKSFYYIPDTEVMGTFSKGFLARIAMALKPFISQKTSRVSRID